MKSNRKVSQDGSKDQVAFNNLTQKPHHSTESIQKKEDNL